MDEVIWRTLIYQNKNFEKFEISTNGKLRNSSTRIVYKTHINGNGYEQVCVSLGSRKQKKTFKIHKAVAETFIPNPDNKEEVNHIDGNKENNNVNNLEWVSGKENMKHAADNKLLNPNCGVDHPSAKLTKEDVIYIREHYVRGDKQYGFAALGRKFNVHPSIIYKVVNNKSYVNV